METNKELSDKVFDALEKEHIEPKPKWSFLLKNGFLWMTAALALTVGAFAFAAIIFALQNGDTALYMRLSDSFWGHLMTILPLAWIVSLSLFVGVASYQMHHTERGYRHSTAFFVGVTFIISMMLGYVLYIAGMGHIIDTRVARVLPIMESIEERRQAQWVQPERGVLAGYVTATTSEYAYLTDYMGDEWKIAVDELPELDRAILERVEEVGIIGEKVGTSTFEACGVRPWALRGESTKIRDQMRAQVLKERLPLNRDRARLSPLKEEIDLLEGRRRGMGANLGERNISELRTIVCEGR